MGAPRRPARVAILSVAWAMGYAAAQQAPLSYDLRQPLCRQLQLGPELMAALTPPLASSLGLPEPVKPPPPPAGAGGVAPVHLGDLTAPPPTAKGAGQPTLAVPALVKVTMDLPELLKRIRAGEYTAEVDLNLRMVEAKPLIEALGKAVAESPRSFFLVQRLAAAVAAGDADLAAPGTLTAAARLPVCTELMRRRDERCVALCELALSEWGRHEGPVEPLGTLASYYRATKQYDKSAATWLRGGRYSSSTSDLLEYEACAGIDLMLSGDSKRGGVLIADAVSQAAGGVTALRLAGTLDSAGLLTCVEGRLDQSEILIKASAGLAKTKAAGIWHLQRCRLLLAKGKQAEAKAACSEALDIARATMAAADAAAAADATDDTRAAGVAARSWAKHQMAMVDEVATWFALRDGKPIRVQPDRLPLGIAGMTGPPLRVTARSRGRLTCSSSADWLTCRVMEAGPQQTRQIPPELAASTYTLLPTIAPTAPRGAEAKLTVRWVDGDQVCEIEVPVVVSGQAAAR